MAVNLPDSAWWDDYYTPMLERMKELRFKNAGVAEAEAVYAHCEAEGIAMYGGGMGELGPARRQVQLLASLFHPDGPNDVAPPPFNLPVPVEGLPASPLAVGPPAPGFSR